MHINVKTDIEGVLLALHGAMVFSLQVGAPLLVESLVVEKENFEAYALPTVERGGGVVAITAHLGIRVRRVPVRRGAVSRLGHRLEGPAAGAQGRLRRPRRALLTGDG